MTKEGGMKKQEASVHMKCTEASCLLSFEKREALEHWPVGWLQGGTSSEEIQRWVLGGEGEGGLRKQNGAMVKLMARRCAGVSWCDGEMAGAMSRAVGLFETADLTKNG